LITWFENENMGYRKWWNHQTFQVTLKTS